MQQLVILLHSSKTMRIDASNKIGSLRPPALIREATELGTYLKSLNTAGIEKSMHVSESLASRTKETIDSWHPKGRALAIDSFIGDIYSGLRAGELSKEDRDYADHVLWILSGLYGFLQPYDAIAPYRLEMGYKLPKYPSLYSFWSTKIADHLPADAIIVNTSSVEYTKAVLPYVDPKRVITPNFMTINPKTGQPAFTTVHAKIARGAFARWLITSRITDPARFKEFSDLGYAYDASLSTSEAPVFVCREFGGIGLSIRLT